MTRDEARREAVKFLLNAAAQGRGLYNVDFTNWKDAANRAFEEALDKFRSTYVYGHELTDSERDLVNAMPLSGLHNFPSRKVLKAIEAADDAAAHDLRNAMLQAVQELITEWKPVGDAIKTLKPYVIKGRKPSANSRKTPERTIENTGTCSVCGKNVKLKGGQIVSHGYRVQWHQHVGNCPGVNYEPIEVSPKGAAAYLEAIMHQHESVLARLMSLSEDTDIRDVAEHRRVTFRLESEKRFLERVVAEFTKVIENWEPSDLPGGTK